jgi:hypothetical protein
MENLRKMLGQAKIPQIHRLTLALTTKNLFEKRFLDFQKLFIIVILRYFFFFVSLRVTSWLKIGDGTRTRRPRKVVRKFEEN